MAIIKRTSILGLLSAVVFLSLLTLSCKKETTDKYLPGDTVRVNADLPYNDIRAFTVCHTSDTLLKAAVIHDSIYVYWPSYWGAPPDSVNPVISISDSAKISPASGRKVALKTGTIYTVSAQSGATHTYTLNLVVHQPQPWYNSENASGTFSWPVSGIGNIPRVNGDFFIPDTSLTHVSLVDKNGKEIKVPIGIDGYPVSVTGFNYIVPAGLDTGTYTLKIVSGWQTAQGQDFSGNPTAAQVVIRNPPPSPPTIDSVQGSTGGQGYIKTVRQGGQLTFFGGSFIGIGTFQVTADFISYYTCQVVGYTSTSLTVQLPANIPPGENYYYPVITSQYGDGNGGPGTSNPSYTGYPGTNFILDLTITS